MGESACLAVKNIGKPDAGKLHVRFDEGGQGNTCSLLYPWLPVTENGVTYSYDLNGNLASRTDNTGTTTYHYNYDDRMVRVKTPTQTLTYAYDVDGNRLETAGPEGTTRYLVDANRSLSQILAEYSVDGTVEASYVYGDDIISMTRDGDTHWYHFDGLGSTRLLTDNSGIVADTYDYDAFGNLLARTGSTDNAFLFTGQRFDPNTRFYHLRARYYQPDVGVFTTIDPWAGDVYTPATLHKYLYTAGNPVDYVDLSGRNAVSTAFAMGLSFTIKSIAIPMVATLIAFAALSVDRSAGPSAGELNDPHSVAASRLALIAASELSSMYSSLAEAVDIAIERIRRFLRRNENFKVIPISRKIMPTIAAHISAAQVTHPKILTRTTPAQAAKNRAAALRGLPRLGGGMSWDEYPFASSTQGGSGASTMAVPIKEQMIQGGIIAGSYSVQNISIGESYWVVVIP